MKFKRSNNTKPMDIVYVVKYGNFNPELRMSLRTLQNFKFPVNNVILAGYCPEWASNVLSLPVTQVPHAPFSNTTRILMAVCSDPRVSDNFILMNDDFFINQPITEIPVLHRGKLKDHLHDIHTSSAYGEGMRNAYDYLLYKGVREPLNYDLHVPMVINKDKMLKVLNDIGDAHSHKRSVYGNLYNLGGKEMADVKIYNEKWDSGMMFVSTSDDAFRVFGVGKALLKKFDTPSIYEPN